MQTRKSYDRETLVDALIIWMLGVLLVGGISVCEFIRGHANIGCAVLDLGIPSIFMLAKAYKAQREKLIFEYSRHY